MREDIPKAPWLPSRAHFAVTSTKKSTGVFFLVVGGVRCRHTALEALKIGRGGLRVWTKVLGISRRTIYNAIREPATMAEDVRSPPLSPSGNVKHSRCLRGSRPRATQRQARLAQAFDAVIEAHTTGSPADPIAFFTDLEQMQLARKLPRRIVAIGRNTLAWLSECAGYHRRSLLKGLVTTHVNPQQRERQFHHIDALPRHVRACGNPVLCVDTRSKEPPGETDGTAVHYVYEQVFRALAQRPLEPHVTCDYFDNVGYMTLDASRERSAFFCDAIALPWDEDRQSGHNACAEIALTFDANGNNATRSLPFDEYPVGLGARLRSSLRVARYPLCTCHWRRIQHRPYSHVGRSMRAIALDSHETTLEAVQPTCTETGLRVKARIRDKVYDLGRECSDTVRNIADRFILHDHVFGLRNYAINAKGFS